MNMRLVLITIFKVKATENNANQIEQSEVRPGSSLSP